MTPEFVSVPVPLERVQEVYELLARARGAAVPAGSSPVGSAQAWPEDLLVRAYRESSPAMRVVIDHLIAHADEEVTTEDLRIAVAERRKKPDYTRGQLAGVFGAFGRRWKNRYQGGGHPSGRWPFDAEWSAERGMVVYRMSAEVAKVMRPKQ